MSASNYLEDMNIVIVGHVDHGKSTIIGRLLADTNSLPQGKLEQLKEKCRRNSKPFEYAFLLDALKDEQSQGITIDSARCFFKTKKRNYIIIDAPGHIEFLKNMITGASRAEAALLVIDAKEGVKENSRRHGYMLSMLGIKQVAVLINKIDLVEYSQGAYEKVVNEYSQFLQKIGITPSNFVPVSGMMGDNIAVNSKKTPWYDGETVLEILDKFKTEKLPEDKPFRMPVQSVYKFTSGGDDRRIISGTVEAGKLNKGDEVIFYPSGKSSRVKSIEAFNSREKTSIGSGYATGFTLNEQIFVKRGEIATLKNQPTPKVADKIKVNLFWLGKEPLVKNKEYHLKLGTAKVKAKLDKILSVIDASNLSQDAKKEKIEKHDVAECVLSLNNQIAFDLMEDLNQTSRFVLVDNYEIAGGGLIQEVVSEQSSVVKMDVSWHQGEVNYSERCANLNQKGMVIWLTGLSGSGKSTLAVELEKELIKQGKAAYRLDGDNLRHGINADLGFSAQDRQENIRRISEIAALFKDAGMITLVSAISPFKKTRDFARKKIGKDSFFEIYVKADLETCAKRDVKGLYKKAQRGEIKDFTGISSPYEEPENPELSLDTNKLSVEEAVEKVLDLITFHQEEKQII